MVTMQIDIAIECARLQRRLTLPPLEMDDFSCNSLNDSKASLSGTSRGSASQVEILQEVLSVASATRDLINSSIYPNIFCWDHSVRRICVSVGSWQKKRRDSEATHPGRVYDTRRDEWLRTKVQGREQESRDITKRINDLNKRGIWWFDLLSVSPQESTKMATTLIVAW